MLRKLKYKLIAGILTALNSGFLYYVIGTKNMQFTDNNNIFISFFHIILNVFIITTVYVVPLIFLLGIPTSILVDFIILKRLKLNKNIVSFILHMTLFELGILIYWIASSGLSRVLNMSEPTLAYLLFLFSYTPAVFWMIDYALQRIISKKNN